MNIPKLAFDEILEYADFAELENYLFEPNETDFEQFVKNELRPEKIKDLEKGEIMQMIEEVLFPTCLWERVFSGIGDMKEWKEALKKVHDIRNGVAHHKIIQENTKRFSKINLGLQSSLKIFSKNMAMISSFGLGNIDKAIKPIQVPQLRAIEMTQRVQNLSSQMSLYGAVKKDD